MLIVADDLTGAAEVGGVAWRHGLEARVVMGRAEETGGGVVVVDTETREAAPKEAAAVVRWAVAGSRVFYKKVDSVLRGPVRAELEALLEACGARRVLVAPANPGLGRTVQEGVYYIGGVPLAETEFGVDPRHPIKSSRVVELLERTPGRARVAWAAESAGAEDGIVVCDAATEQDLRAWAGRVDAGTLAAGAAGFLSAVLEENGYRERRRAAGETAAGGRLIVSGTASTFSRKRLEEMEAAGIPVRRPMAPWGRVAAAAVQDLDRRGMAVLAVARADGKALAKPLVGAARAVVESGRVKALWVEGGATAAAVARRLGWTAFTVRAELRPGVVALAPDARSDLEFVAKPGSYRWSF